MCSEEKELDDSIRHMKNLHGWSDSKCDEQRERINMKSFDVDNLIYKSSKGNRLDMSKDSFTDRKMCPEAVTEKVSEK